MTLALAGLAGAAAGQTKTDPPEERPWQARLGLRVRRVDRSFPVVDQVVLVPDAATYIDELHRWSPRGRWPVLIEDDRDAPRFIRRFRPARVLRRSSVGPLPTTSEARRRLMEALVVRVWAGDPARDDDRAVFEAQSYAPPGVVIADDADPAWTAAVALAAGRGQPLAWLDGAHGAPDDAARPEAMERLRADVEGLVRATGWSYGDLGDDIDAVTLCRAVAGKGALALSAGTRYPAPDHDHRPRAVTDVVGRDADGRRWAMCGWIFGSERRSAYVAMCSLFLPRTRARLIDTYHDDGVWREYRVGEAAKTMHDDGWETEVADRARTTEVTWRRMLPAGLDTDLLLVNSSGDADYFNLGSGRGTPGDVPELHAPVAVHFVHSWSAKAPTDPTTVAAAWLDRGAYAYVGSVDEPFLSAFVTPRTLVDRLRGAVPLLVAARHFRPPLDRPWKVNTLGDPLMLCVPPADTPPDRLPPGEHDGIRLDDAARAALRGLGPDAPDGRYAEAVRTLALLGRDDLAVEVWRRAAARPDGAPATAAAALGPLFRRGEGDGLLDAWSRLEAPDPARRHLPWHVLAPSLHRLDDRGRLALLERSVRPGQPEVDLAVLAPHLARVFGRARAVAAIEAHLDTAPDERSRSRLESLLRKYRED
jgi:hypothetical protein